MDDARADDSTGLVLAQGSICLLAATELDRAAYRALLAGSMGLTARLAESSLAPVQVWKLLREKPGLMIAISDVATSEVRDVLQMVPRLSRGTRVLAVAGAEDPMSMQAWGQCPLDGLVVKNSPPEELSSAVAALLRGGTFYSRGVRETLNGCRDRGSVQLSARETELLPLLARGLTLREAAARMAIGYKTADSYRTSMLRKLGLRDRVSLTRYAIREGIIDA
ncbi:MAG: response regulator transcription factor [Phycisphaerae bacterium]